MDLNLVQIRTNSGVDSTLGVLGIPAEKEFLCYTCEDEYREVKVANETRIPQGRYEILLRKEGSVHPRYKKAFKKMHKGMLWLQDVPNFTWIYIHMGNNDDDSSGCILVGETPVPDTDDGGGRLINSRDAYVRVYKRIMEAMDNGDRVFITIRDWC